LSTHEALDGVDGVFGVNGSLPAGKRADQPLTTLGEGDYGRCGTRTFRVRDDDRLAALHDGDDRVGRPEVDSYGFRHLRFLHAPWRARISIVNFLFSSPHLRPRNPLPVVFRRCPSSSSSPSTTSPWRRWASRPRAG